MGTGQEASSPRTSKSFAVRLGLAVVAASATAYVFFTSSNINEASFQSSSTGVRLRRSLEIDGNGNTTQIVTMLTTLDHKMDGVAEDIKRLAGSPIPLPPAEPQGPTPQVEAVPASRFEHKDRPIGRFPITDQIIQELWLGHSPLEVADPARIDTGYPHTNILPELIDVVLQEQQPKFWLEMGSMLGGSIIRTADAAKRLDVPTSIVAVDPFTGDVNMWAWEKEKRAEGWSHLQLSQDRPTIYDRFLANVRNANHDDCVVPILCTSIVGMKLLHRLHAESRLSALPDVIYLDSAHEKGETLLELGLAWELLQPGGVLFGDDWAWDAVKGDVSEFAQTINVNSDKGNSWVTKLAEAQMEGNVLLYRGQWVLLKPS